MDSTYQLRSFSMYLEVPRFVTFRLRLEKLSFFFRRGKRGCFTYKSYSVAFENAA